MERIGVRDLRQNASRYLEAVKRGESVEVTERGNLIAILVPPAPSLVARDVLVGRGQLIPASHRFVIPDVLATSEETSSSALDDLRQDRL